MDIKNYLWENREIIIQIIYQKNAESKQMENFKLTREKFKQSLLEQDWNEISNYFIRDKNQVEEEKREIGDKQIDTKEVTPINTNISKKRSQKNLIKEKNIKLNQKPKLPRVEKKKLNEDFVMAKNSSSNESIVSLIIPPLKDEELQLIKNYFLTKLSDKETTILQNKINISIMECFFFLITCRSTPAISISNHFCFESFFEIPIGLMDIHDLLVIENARMFLSNRDLYFFSTYQKEVLRLVQFVSNSKGYKKIEYSNITKKIFCKEIHVRFENKNYHRVIINQIGPFCH
eukprot:TRINITY_DN16478_c0_g1_i1.p1 TRINITY_DN16478_c0_g1~~TRINITY_DN16478_c0_g1_i1.p1  ORF type:complete len:315 (+),score=65.90 TRINITY_DN16478_c0_g1_i1:78-947(+)